MINEDCSPAHQMKRAHTLDSLYLDSFDQETQHFIFQILETPEFSRLLTEREQVAYIYYKGKETCFNFSIRKLAQLFNISKAAVERHLLQHSKNEVKIGRPKLLTQEEHNSILQFINDQIENFRPTTYQSISDFLFQNFEKNYNMQSLRCYLKNSRDLKIVQGIPLESQRALVKSEEIDQYYRELSEILSVRIPSQFVINIDEVGFTEFYQTKKVKCVVPYSFNRNTIQYASDRNTSHSTMLAGITANGDSLRPLLLMERQTCEMELLRLGYTPDKMMICNSPKGYINNELFNTWIKNMFYPEIREKRNISNFSETAILILDNLNCHTSDEFMQYSFEHENILIKPIPPHSSDQLQPLDLGIFSVLKRNLINFSPPRNLNKQTQNICKIYDAYRSATSPKNVIGAFRNAGIISEFDFNLSKLYANVDTSYATKVRHFNNSERLEMEGDKRRIYL